MGFIRLMLAIAVFNSHFPFLEMPIVDGHEAVLAFFAISGFYMALILDTAYTSPGRFYLGRLLSLYPLYLFALALSIALLATLDVHPMTGQGEVRSLLGNPASFLVMLWTSTCVLGQELLFCLGLGTDGGLVLLSESRNALWRHAPLIQAWSLSLEITFYALAPLLVRLKHSTLAGLVLMSLTAKIAVMCTTLGDAVVFKRFFPTEFWLFGLGIFAYRLHKSLPPHTRWMDISAFLALAAAIGVADIVPDWAEPFALPVLTVLSLPLVFRLFKHSPLDRLAGKVSYPFYLLHFSFIALFETYSDEPVGWHILAFTLVAAFVSHAIFHPGIDLLKNTIRAIPYLAPSPWPAAHGVRTIKP